MHLGIILPHGYRGGTLRGALNIARMLKRGAAESGTPISVSFGHLDDRKLYCDEDFEPIRREGISVRPYQRKVVADRDLAWHFDSDPEVPERRRAEEYLLFNDGIANFEDCDFWLIVSDRVNLPLPAHRRYAVVVYDYIQRYVPEIFGTTPETDLNWKEFDHYAQCVQMADFVICTTEQTRRDCVSYAGVDPERVYRFPMEFDPVRDAPMSAVSSPTQSEYVVWTTNTNLHKNHEVVIDGLERFFAAHPESPLRVRVTGAMTSAFAEDAKSHPLYEVGYVSRVRRSIAQRQEVRSRISFLGELDDTRYLEELRGAELLIHSSIYDNGTFSVIEAAWVGVPSLSSDYPAMREVAEDFRLPLTFFDSSSASSFACSLATTLAERDQLRARMPSRHTLTSHSFERLARSYWDKFSSAMERHGPR